MKQVAMISPLPASPGNGGPTLVECWGNVCDAAPTFSQRWVAIVYVLPRGGTCLEKNCRCRFSITPSSSLLSFTLFLPCLPPLCLINSRSGANCADSSSCAGSLLLLRVVAYRVPSISSAAASAVADRSSLRISQSAASDAQAELPSSRIRSSEIVRVQTL